jgi:pimeloyl-ACP methyl ester carboxylesterase
VLPLALLVLVFALVFIAGQILQRVMESPDIGDLRRAEVSTVIDGEAGVRVSYLNSPGARSPGDTPIVYVHGTPGDATNFLSFVQRPVEGRFSVALDRPGFGASSNHRSFVSFADQARAVIAVLDRLELDRAILVGHSLGGPIAARAAADAPDRVAGIVQVAGSLDPDLEKLQWYNFLLQWWPITKLLPRSFILSNEEVLAARGQCLDLQPALKQISCPVMIVHGSDDRLVPYANVEYMQRKFVNASRLELRTLEGADHFLPWAQEAELREAIAEMIDWVDEGQDSTAAAGFQ